MSILLKISNKALRKLGVREIMSLTQQGKAAERCNAAVLDIVKEVTEVHPWGHAEEWGTLPVNATPPPFGFEFSYQLPNGAVALFDIRAESDLKAPKIDFKRVRGNAVYTDASPCYARYVIFNQEDLARASDLFIDTCAFKLAAEISSPLAKLDMMGAMLQGYGQALDVARLRDAAQMKERQQDENRTNTILAARGYPGVINDDQRDEV